MDKKRAAARQALAMESINNSVADLQKEIASLKRLINKLVKASEGK